MGFKRRHGLAGAADDAKKILAVIDADKFMNTSYGDMVHATGFSQQRVEQAVLHIQRTTGEIEYVEYGATRFSFRRKHQRPRSSPAERLLGKEEVDGSIPSLGSTTTTETPTCRKIHYWPDGIPKQFENRNKYNLWCGTWVGAMRYKDGVRRIVSYHWSRNMKKVTCLSCKRRHLRNGMPRQKDIGIMEVV